MTKITNLDPILAENTRGEDLFVIVSIALGEDGTRSITLDELARALGQTVLEDIYIDGGCIKNVQIIDPNIDVNTDFTPPIQDNDYFYLKDLSLDQTVALSYSQLYTELSRSAKKSKKIYVAEDGNDNNIGSYLDPVATLEKAFELANASPVTVSITVLPGTYYTNGELALPDDCSLISTNGQYSTNIIMNPGFESKNCILLGSGCYAQGFSFQNNKVDNFDYPSGGFAFAFRPGARIVRSPYVRDSSQISNYFRRTIAEPLNPFNSKGTLDDLGTELNISSITGTFEVDDLVTFSGGSTGYVTRVEEIGSGIIYVRNISGLLFSGETVTASTGGTATLQSIGEDDFPNKLVGRGGGMLLADRAILDQDSIFPYMLAFGATPRTPNGLGYVARNGAGINGISSLSIFTRCSFYALDGGQITLNNSGTQFGDISMRAKGITPIFNPFDTDATLIESDTFADDIIASSNNIIDYVWSELDGLGYDVNEELTRRDANNLLLSISNDFKVGEQKGTKIFTAGLFNYEGRHVFSVFEPSTSNLRFIGTVASVGDLPAGSTVEINDAYIVYTNASNFYDGSIYFWDGTDWVLDGPNDITLLNAFLDSFDKIREYIVDNLSPTTPEELMLDGLIDDVLKTSLKTPNVVNFGSLIESLSHQFNNASAGVNKNALPLNFRNLGRSISAQASVLQENGGRVRWSGADELNNQYFARGLRINGRTGRIEGRPFTSSVRKLARRAANSRAQI